MAKENKPRWKDLPFYDRFARELKRDGACEEICELNRQKRLTNWLISFCFVSAILCATA